MQIQFPYGIAEQVGQRNVGEGLAVLIRIFFMPYSRPMEA